jgi:hypothetical protein
MTKLLAPFRFVWSIAILGLIAVSAIAQPVEERYVPFSAVIYGGHSLKGDGIGPYEHGKRQSQVSGLLALNIWVWDHTSPVSNKPDPDANAPYERRMLFDLTHPVPDSGAKAVETTFDYLARFHVMWKHDHETEKIYGMDTIPVGATVDSDRVEMWPSVNGVQHVLQMGPFALGEFSPRAALNGKGTTKAKITRETEDVWRIVASSGSIARLWDYSDIQKPVDKGLYYFDFDVRFTRVR